MASNLQGDTLYMITLYLSADHITDQNDANQMLFVTRALAAFLALETRLHKRTRGNAVEIWSLVWKRCMSPIVLIKMRNCITAKLCILI